MELGELELALLRALRSLGEARPKEIYNEVKKERDIAYTSVTTTLYRLVEKKLVKTRRIGLRKVIYLLNEDGKDYRIAVEGMLDRLLKTFGPATLSHVLEISERIPKAEAEELRKRLEELKKR